MMMAVKNKATKNAVVSMFPDPVGDEAPVVIGTPVTTEVPADAPKKVRKPRNVRPVNDRLAELRAKCEAYKAVSEKKIRDFERRIAVLESKAAKAATDADVLRFVEGKSEDQIQQELLDAAMTLQLLKRAKKLRV